MRASLRPLLAAVVFTTAAGLAAQTPAAPEWGTSSESNVVVSAWDMQVIDSTDTWAMDVDTNNRYLTSAGTLYAGVPVPNGAVIDSVEIDGCDNSTTYYVYAGLWKYSGGSKTLITSVTSSAVDAPGCRRWSVDLPAPERADTQANEYRAYAGTTSADSTTSISAVRVYYHLQVSPAPGTATFNDVPTNHPFFQFVEALASSGITAGCGGGNFCPDAPLTRGQMAVFLSKALGLHWPATPGN